MDERTNLGWGKIIVWSIVGLIVLFGLWSSVTVISTGHRGVVTRFGKVTGRILGEGVHMIMPWEIEQTWIVEVRVRKEQVAAAAASQDLQEVKSTIALNYHLEATEVQWIYQNLGADYKSRIIDPSIQESFKAVTAQYPVADLLTKRPEVKEKARLILEDRLHKNHIIVDDLSIVNFDFSAEFNKSVEQKQVAQQEAERAQYKLDAARKDAEAIKVQGDALKANPELVNWEAVKKWSGQMPVVVGGNMLPFIGDISGLTNK